MIFMLSDRSLGMATGQSSFEIKLCGVKDTIIILNISDEPQVISHILLKRIGFKVSTSNSYRVRSC